MQKRIFLAGIAWVLVFATISSAAEKRSAPVGMQVENFTLKDFRGKTHSLSDFKKNKFVVVMFLGTECPLVKLYATRLEKLNQQFSKQGVAFLGINANRQDSITEIAAYARKHKLTFPILKDLSNRIADKLNAVRTPEVFVLDQNRTVRYHGRIDDQYGVGYIRDKFNREDLRIALNELLTEKPVSQAQTEAVGCFIGRVRTPKPGSAVTYSNQIVRILQKRCVECHRSGEIAPFALTDYEEVVGWAETIVEVIEDQRMPPWFANKKHGHFSNERRMTVEEKQLVFDWVKNGAPEGNRADLPEPVKYHSGWQLPQQPDMIVPMREKPYTVPAEGVVRYQHFSYDPGFKEDKWVTAAEIIPGNRAVVHHVIVFVRPPKGVKNDNFGNGDGFLVVYVPGYRSAPLPAGMAKRIPAGSKLVFQMHYTPIGTEQIDLTKVGLVFTEQKNVKHIVRTVSASTHKIEIPPGAENYKLEVTSGKQRRETLLLSMMPHMHLRGKSFRYEARYPDGKTETLLDVPRYDFNWQTSYRLTNIKRLPAGTQIHCVAHYDNSENNLANPDPTKTIRYGEQTWEEMMFGFYDIAVPNLLNSSKVDQVRAAANLLLKTYDKNGNGEVARNEVADNILPVFKRIDTDGNDIVTLKELIVAVHKKQVK